MQNYPWDQTIFGWIHITSAATVVGGLVFWATLRAAIARAGDGGAEWERAALARFRPFFWTAAGLLLLTGAYTWNVRTKQGYPGFYFHVIYAKILLYVILFGIAGALTKPRETPSGLQRNGSTWLGVCLAICLVILFLSAFMRRVIPVEPPVPNTARITSPYQRDKTTSSVMGTAMAQASVSEKGREPVWTLS